jgi:hypothetical protein
MIKHLEHGYSIKSHLFRMIYTLGLNKIQCSTGSQIAKLYLQHIQQGLPTIAETDLEEKIDAFRKAAENRQSSTEEGER